MYLRKSVFAVHRNTAGSAETRPISRDNSLSSVQILSRIEKNASPEFCDSLSDWIYEARLSG